MAVTIPVGEQLYEVSLKFTGATEFGVSMEALSSGQVLPPPEGARFDLAFAGSMRGTKLSGAVTGVDYLSVRADGRFQLHIHAAITTDDGASIALFADGIAVPREGSSILDLKENVTLTTSASAYSWVNKLQVWGVGTVDLATQEVKVTGYAA
jgi:hypothetical protein